MMRSSHPLLSTSLVLILASSAQAASNVSIDDMTATKFAELQTAGTPGCEVGISSPGHAYRVITYGTSNPETGEPLKAGDRFRIGSVSKLFVGYLLLKEAEAGNLELTQTVSEFVGGVPNGDRITLDMLARHTSGLPNPIANPDFRAVINAAPGAQHEFSDLLAVARRVGAQAEPGERFLYSNLNTELIAEVLRRVTGQSLDALLGRSVRQPFGTETPVVAPGDSFNQTGLRGYRYGAGKNRVEYGEVFFDATGFNTSWAGAGGNQAASIGDLLALVRPVVRAEGLSGRLAARLQQFQTITPDFDYGFHRARYGEAVGHAGDVPGFSSFLVYRERDDLSLAVFCNLSNLRDKQSPATLLGQRLLDLL